MRIQSVDSSGTVTEYPTIQAARLAGHSVLLDDTAPRNGLTWRRVPAKAAPAAAPAPAPAKAAPAASPPKLPIEAICPISRSVKYQFDRLADAVAVGFLAGGIRPCLAGGIVSHAGLWWRIVGDTTPLPELSPDSDSLTKFVAEHLHEAPGHLIPFSEFYERFKVWLPTEEQHNWTQIKTTRGLPLKFQTGRGNASKVFLINCSWDAAAVKGPPYVVGKGGRIRRGDSKAQPNAARS
jgi:hypothetical protein